MRQARHGLVRWLYIATVFVSAGLLFAVQPMFTKMVLPRLGGAPAVWSVAMVFFQTALLGGYAYAHALVRFASPPRAAAVQVALLIAACFALPLGIAAGWGRAPPRGEALWLMGLFAASIGLPFFALSANAPLLQAWFARTGHPAAKDPYFLYAASNVGSFLALLAYPFAAEPFTRLGDQTTAWSIVFLVLIGLIAACGIVAARASRLRPDASSGAAPAPTFRDAIAWLAIAAVPAGLLVAVTAHISTDIGAAPLLWVVPLALYLATFVIVFQTRPIIPHGWPVAVQPFFIVALSAVLIFQITHHILWLIALNLAAFFVAALVCHGALARRRPAAEHLTAFYMWMSAGGMIGGLCAALLAPLLFSWIAEYPLLIVLAILCRPGLTLPRGREAWRMLGAAIAIAALMALPALAWGYRPDDREFKAVTVTLLVLAMLSTAVSWHALVRMIPRAPGLALPRGREAWLLLGTAAALAALLALPALVWGYRSVEREYKAVIGTLLIVGGLSALVRWRAPLPFAAFIAAAFLMFRLYEPDDGRRETVRSFFGVLKITDSSDGFRVLQHGTTIHGAERLADVAADPPARPEPLTYYHANSALTRVIAAARARNGEGEPLRVAVVGLGTGSLACYAEPGDTWDFYEIDPAVVRITHDERRFTFLSRCTPEASIVLGDARIMLSEAEHRYDVIAVDAFSSDTIPVHLLTREAMQVYLEKLAPHGVIAMHVSNRHLELASVVAGIAQAHGLTTRRNPGTDDDEQPDNAEYKFTSTVVVAARSDADFGALAEPEAWPEETPGPGQWVWTDDYSNIVGAVLRHLRE